MKSLRRSPKKELLSQTKTKEARPSDEGTKDAASVSTERGPLDEGAAERLKAILQTAVEGIITINELGVIESVNPAAERMFGYESKELVGKRVNALMPQPFSREHDGYIQNYLSSGQARIIGIGREVVGKRKNGTVFPIDLSVSEVSLKSRRIFTGFLRDISERKMLEDEILAASENEQRRIGRDLHDGLCQQLAGIEFMSQALEKRLVATSPSDAESAAHISQLMREAISQTRDLARGLSPVILEPDGLMGGLKLMAENVRTLFGVHCEFECQHRVLLRDNTAATHLFRIAQEAVTNAIRHGRAKRIRVGLSATPPNQICLVVEDNGRGIPKTRIRSKGMGLRIMEYRAGRIGASLVVRRGKPRGTSIVCSLHQTYSGPSAIRKS